MATKEATLITDPVLAAQKDALGVDRLDAVPGFRFGRQDRVVVRRHDAGVVVDDIDPAVTAHRLREHRLHAIGTGHIGGLEEGLPALGGRLLPRLPADVRDADPGALRREQERRLPADAARGARDHRHLSVQPSHQTSVETNTFLTSE
jgi:hypothetical protein